MKKIIPSALVLCLFALATDSVFCQDSSLWIISAEKGTTFQYGEDCEIRIDVLRQVAALSGEIAYDPRYFGAPRIRLFAVYSTCTGILVSPGKVQNGVLLEKAKYRFTLYSAHHSDSPWEIKRDAIATFCLQVTSEQITETNVTISQESLQTAGTDWEMSTDIVENEGQVIEIGINTAKAEHWSLYQ